MNTENGEPAPQWRDSDLDAALVPPAPYRMPVDATCWADPLSRTERRVVAAMLAAHCKRFYNAGTTAQDGRRGTDRQAVHALICTSAEMSDLHLDVTERAEVAL